MKLKIEHLSSGYDGDVVLKDLSLEEGRAAVEGQIAALIFEEPRQRSRLGRLFG